MKNIYRNSVPYTTKSGLQIGIAYQPPVQRITHEGEIVQSALLGVRSPKFLSSGSIWYYTCVVVLLIIIAAVMNK
jgi:hypothetical protein